MREYLAPGTKVAFNGKNGVVIRIVKHRIGTFYSRPEAIVQLEGRDEPSKIELDRLQIIDQA